MRQIGLVKELESGRAKIEIKRESACGGNCAGCGGCSGMSREIYAENVVNARIGDTVLVEMKDSDVLRAAFLAYMVPLAALIIGYFVVFFITDSELFSAIASFALMLAAYAIIHFVDKRMKNEYIHRIVEVIDTI